MAADERIAAEGKGKFGLSEVILGVSVPACLMEPFRHVVGARHMERLAATGENVAVDRALAIGLVDRVVPAGELLDRAVERARFLAGLSGAAYAAIKLRSRAAAIARFDQARDHDPFLDFWFSEDARFRLKDMVARLSEPVIPPTTILDALDLSRAEPGSGFLEALFARFNAKVPFENASKIVRDARGRRSGRRSRGPRRSSGPSTSTSGTGGTCFARVAAFDALLSALGVPDAAPARPRPQRDDDHAALLVETPAGESIVDVGFPLPAILPARAGPRRRRARGRSRSRTTARGLRIAFVEGVAGDAARDRDVHGAPVPTETVRGALARDLPARARGFCGRSRCGAISATGCSRTRRGRCASTTCTRACACRLPAAARGRAVGALRHRRGESWRGRFAGRGERWNRRAGEERDA